MKNTLVFFSFHGCPYVPMPVVKEIYEHVVASEEYGRVVGLEVPWLVSPYESLLTLVVLRWMSECEPHLTWWN